MTAAGDRGDRLSVWILGLIVFVWGWLAVMQIRGDWVVRVEGFASASGKMALYVDRGGGFSEFEVYTRPVRGGEVSEVFRFRRGGVRSIRWDGLDRVGTVRVDRLAWVEPGRFRAGGQRLEEAVETNGVRVNRESGDVFFEHRDGWLRFVIEPMGDLRFGLLAALPSLTVSALMIGFSFLWNRRMRVSRREVGAEIPGEEG